MKNCILCSDVISFKSLRTLIHELAHAFTFHTVYKSIPQYYFENTSMVFIEFCAILFELLMFNRFKEESFYDSIQIRQCETLSTRLFRYNRTTFIEQALFEQSMSSALMADTIEDMYRSESILLFGKEDRSWHLWDWAKTKDLFSRYYHTPHIYTTATLLALHVEHLISNAELTQSELTRLVTFGFEHNLEGTIEEFGLDKNFWQVGMQQANLYFNELHTLEKGPKDDDPI
jgi:oligoendopeptidase F